MTERGPAPAPVELEPVRPRKAERAPRASTFKQATLILPYGERFPCVIKNISDTGARVEFFRHIILPDDVVLTEVSLRLRVPARVVWQSDGAAGLRFIPG